MNIKTDGVGAIKNYNERVIGKVIDSLETLIDLGILNGYYLRLGKGDYKKYASSLDDINKDNFMNYVVEIIWNDEKQPDFENIRERKLKRLES